MKGGTVEVPMNGRVNYFTAHIGDADFDQNVIWKANRVAFKYGSEHIIGKKRVDLEMQVFHKPAEGMGDGKIDQAVLSVLFSTSPPNDKNLNGKSPKWVSDQIT